MDDHDRLMRRDRIVARRTKEQHQARWRLAMRVRLLHIGRRWAR